MCLTPPPTPALHPTMTQVARSMDSTHGILHHRELCTNKVTDNLCLSGWCCVMSCNPPAPLGWLGCAWESPWRSWKKWLARRRSGHLCSDYYPRDPNKYRTINRMAMTSFFLEVSLRTKILILNKGDIFFSPSVLVCN